MAAHRYWRLLVTANNGNAYTALASLVLKTAPGGADVGAGVGTALGNDALFTMEPYRAFDSNTTTIWATNEAGEHYVGKDFGAGNDKDIVEFDIISGRDAETDLTMNPKDFALQYSDDNVTYTSAASFTGETGWGYTETRTYSVSAAAAARAGRARMGIVRLAI